MSNLDANSEVHKKSMMMHATFIRNLKYIRKKYKLTQAKMAERCNLSLQSYSEIERGYAIPSLITAYSISTALGIDIRTLSSKIIKY